MFAYAGGEDNSITLGSFTATLDPETGALVIPDYTDPAAIGLIALSDADKAKLSGRTLSVDIQKGTGAADTVSLAYAHHLRQALAGADGGVSSSNPLRKGATGTSGMPNEDFVGSITVPMANYLISALHIAEFKNTNIIGNGDRWDGIVNNGGIFNFKLNSHY